MKAPRSDATQKVVPLRPRPDAADGHSPPEPAESMPRKRPLLTWILAGALALLGGLLLAQIQRADRLAQRAEALAAEIEDARQTVAAYRTRMEAVRSQVGAVSAQMGALERLVSEDPGSPPPISPEASPEAAVPSPR